MSTINIVLIVVAPAVIIIVDNGAVLRFPVLWLYRPTTFSSSVDAAEKRPLIIGHVRWQGRGLADWPGYLLVVFRKKRTRRRRHAWGWAGLARLCILWPQWPGIRVRTSRLYKIERRITVKTCLRWPPVVPVIKVVIDCSGRWEICFPTHIRTAKYHNQKNSLITHPCFIASNYVIFHKTPLEDLIILDLMKCSVLSVFN